MAEAMIAHDQGISAGNAAAVLRESGADTVRSDWSD